MFGFHRKRPAAAHAVRAAGPALAAHGGEAAWRVLEFDGAEQVNALFAYRLLLCCASTAPPPARALLGREISVHVEAAAPCGERAVHALVAAARCLGADPAQPARGWLVELELRPWLHLAGLAGQCRVWRGRSVPEVLTDLLAPYRQAVDLRLEHKWSARARQVQFNQTDLECFECIAQHWGINYHFEHRDGRCRLVLSDHNPGLDARKQGQWPGLKLLAEAGHGDAEGFERFRHGSRLGSESWLGRAHDLARPGSPRMAKAAVRRGEGEAEVQPARERYVWQGELGAAMCQAEVAAASQQRMDADDACARWLAQARMEALRQHAARAVGCGRIRGLGAGQGFVLRDHALREAGAAYLTVRSALRVRHVAASSVAAPQARGVQDAAAAGWDVWCEIEAQPAVVALRPELTRPPPRVWGVQSGVVVGHPDAAAQPVGDVCTDALGRVAVRMLWEGEAQDAAQPAGCWMRVARPWAGNRYGSVSLPRLGQEVAVGFVDGDLNMPVCLGQAYNGDNLPPWDLPANAALTGVRSRELGARAGPGNSAAGASNHLVFDDTPEQLQLQLRSDTACSSLSLGEVRDLKGCAGRDRARGKGAELRTDAKGVLRAGRGMLLSSSRADVAGAGANLPEDLVPEPAALQAKPDPNGAEGPVVVESAVTLGVAASQRGHVHAQENLCLRAGAQQALDSGAWMLAAAGGAVRALARGAGMRLWGDGGGVRARALDDRLELVARGVLSLVARGELRIRARKGVLLQGGSSAIVLRESGAECRTGGVFGVEAARGKCRV